MAQQRNLPQSKDVLLKSYNTRLKEDCKIMLENYFGNTQLTLGWWLWSQCRIGLLHLHIWILISLFPAEIIKLAKGETDSQLSKITQCEQDTYEMQVRAANIGMLTQNINNFSSQVTLLI